MCRLVGFLLLSLTCVIFGQTKNVPKRPYCELSDQAAHFNFTPLSESPIDHIINNEKHGESIRLRLCEPLHKPCNDMPQYSVCLTKDNVEKGIGKAPPDSVSASSGQLKFQFTGDTCKGDTNYSVQVIMRCDNEAGYKTQPELFPHDSDQCSYYLVWKTKAACGTEHTVNCTAVDKNNQHYDLSSLTLRSENYLVPVANTSNSVMILNVCHSIIYDYNVTCPPKAGACLREIEKPNKTVFKNLGRVIKSPYFDDKGVLTLKYETGEICLPVPSKFHVETVIVFECDHQATNTLPVYEGGAEECLYKFRWKTAAACSVESLKNQSIESAGTCKVTNPLTNIEYNFQELMSKDFRSKSSNGTVYTFQICGAISNDSCPAGSGACDPKTKISMGAANTKLMWNRGGPYLNYTDGTECGKNRRRYTQIAFFCGAEESLKAPIVMEEEDCALIIHWNTPLVCDKRIKCETKSGDVSLTSLIRSSDNYIVKMKDTEFNINVCRPLVPKPYLTCLHGSAACQVLPQANGQFINEISLGYPDENPFVDEEKHVTLRYTGGSPCPEDKSNSLSSNVTFLCNYASAIGAPRYKYYRSCTHVFEWPTSVVCEKIEGRWTSGCIIENPRLSQKINLTSLREKAVHSVTSIFGDRYNVSLCGGIKFCNGSAVCKGDQYYGSNSSVIFDYPRNAIILKFSQGSRCKSGFSSSEVRLICDESAGNGEPKLLEFGGSVTSCSVAFEWRTKVVCVNQSVVEVPMNDGAKTTLDNVVETATGHVGKDIGIGILIFCCIAVIVYLWSSERRARLRNCCNSLTTRRDRCRAQYTKGVKSKNHQTIF